MINHIQIFSTVNCILWKLLLPIRYYIQNNRIHRGKKFLIEFILLPLLPTGYFKILINQQYWLQLNYQETIGWTTLISQQLFEQSEINILAKYANTDSYFIDIGANIGLYSILFSSIVSQVIAVEPLEDYIFYLQQAQQINQIANIQIFPFGLANIIQNNQDFYRPKDGAFASINWIKNAKILKIEIRTLDWLWQQLNYPDISIIKIDVEGNEFQVLNGGLLCIQTCKPVMLIEANNDFYYQQLLDLLLPLNYQVYQPQGFKPWNYLFIPQ